MRTLLGRVTTALMARTPAVFVGAWVAVAGTVAVAPAQPPAAPAAPDPAAPLTLDDAVRLAVERNPRLARATLAVDAARGRQVQAGLYPNPVFNYTADELADRTGPVGIHSPVLSQEIVRGGKLRLSQAVAAKEVDQAALAVLAERYAVIGQVRAAFFDAYALQERKAVQDELAGIFEGLAARLGPAVGRGAATRLDLLRVEMQRERARAEAKAIERELPAAFRRLAAVAGAADLPPRPLTVPLDAPLPDYDPDRTQAVVLATHPEVRSAHVAAERARLALRRAQAEPTPNVTVSAGYVYQGQNRSNDLVAGLSLPLPAWDKNQGNIRAAQAEALAAEQGVRRVENELAERVATAFRTYAAARQRALWYRDHVLGRAREVVELTAAAQKAGQFSATDVLLAQQAVAEARLEYNTALGEAWQAAAALSGLLLEEVWPPAAELTPTESRR